jgi:phosphoribosyl 1,2-cyclic phosphodiesterase
MGVSVSVLASGSRGNCSLVATSTTRILVDAGLSGRETFKRLKSLGERAEEISAILITHEHSDHVAGLQRLATKLNIPVFLTAPTYHAWSRAVRDDWNASPPVAAFAWATSKWCRLQSRTTPPIRWGSLFAPKV